METFVNMWEMFAVVGQRVASVLTIWCDSIPIMSRSEIVEIPIGNQSKLKSFSRGQAFSSDLTFFKKNVATKS